MRTFKYIAVIATVLTMSGAASAQTAFSPQMAQMAQSPMVQQIMKSPMARQIIAKFMTAAMTSKGSSFMKPPFPSMTPPAGGFGLPSFGASAPMGQW
jgi:hypothetical protein